MPTWRIDGTHIITSTRLIAATSTPGLGSPLPHLRRDPAHRCDVFAGICLTPTTSPPRLDFTAAKHASGPGALLPHLSGLGLSAATSALGLRCGSTGTPLTAATSPPCLGSLNPHVCRDRAHRCRLCVDTQLTSVSFAFRLDSQVPHLHLSWAHCCHHCTGPGLTAATSAPGVTAATYVPDPA